MKKNRIVFNRGMSIISNYAVWCFLDYELFEKVIQKNLCPYL